MTRPAREALSRDSREIQDRLVLVTGAGRGIGKRLAIGLAGLGAHVALISRTRAELDLTHLEIQHGGGSSARFTGDVRDAEFLREAVNRAVVQFSRPVDVLVAAAAIQGPIGPMTSNDPALWWQTFDVNIRGTYNACRAVLPSMMEARRGKLIALAGGGVSRPRPNFTAYSASKAGLARMIESLAEELVSSNIQANCLSPGGSYTAMTDEILAAGELAGWKELEDARKVRVSGGVTLDRQLSLTLFLAGSRSNHLTGRLIHVEDDWQRLADSSPNPDTYSLRRAVKP
jgi:3-oxoacyl-[acyl-carrier protein] reductase